MDEVGPQILSFILGLVGLVIGVAVLGGFYNLCRRVAQFRDDQHAVRALLESEIGRAGLPGLAGGGAAKGH